METEQSIEDRIKELIVQVLDLKVAPGEIEDDDLLFGGDIELDSIATLELTAGIEERFGIEIEDEELTAALFENVASLAKFVREKLTVQGNRVRKARAASKSVQQEDGEISTPAKLRSQRANSTVWQEIDQVHKLVSPEHHKALNFLIAHTSLRDLEDIEADLLLEHVEYTYLARETVMWGNRLQEDLLLSYVLPCRTWAEPIEKWRKVFYEELYPLMKSLNTPIEAAMAVNRWAAGKAHFEDLPVTYKTPLRTLKEGCGDCLDLSIFLVAACRSVGIPARGVFSPWMPLGHDGTHMWTEVWDHRWYYLGSCEPERQPDRAWFSMHIKQAAKVYALCFRQTGSRLGLEYCPDIWVEDITERYTPVGRLRVKVSKDGKPLARCRLHLFVPGSRNQFVLVGAVETDEKGLVAVKLGARVETYFVCAGPPGENFGQFVHIDAGRTKEIHLKR